MTQHPILGHISRQHLPWKRHMNPHVHCSTIHNSQDKETSQMSMTDDWIRKKWYINTMEYYSAININKIMPFAATRLEIETHTKWSKSWRDRQIPQDITYIWNLTYGTNESFHKKETHGLGEGACGYQGGGRGSGMDWESGINRGKQLHLGWISNDILLYSTGNYV